jgi:hypothetical protein
MSFQPFFANRAPATSATGSVSQPGSSGGFQRLFTEIAHAESPAPEERRLDAPKVELIEENGRVATIVVTCRCCERIEIACQY